MGVQETEFGRRLARRMARKGMSQMEMAQHCDVAQTLISHFCTGRVKMPTAALLFKIADVLEVDPRWLVTGEGDVK